MRLDQFILYSAVFVPTLGRTLQPGQLEPRGSSPELATPPNHFDIEKRQFRQQRLRVNWIVTLASATDLILNVFVQTESNGRISIVPEQVDLGWRLSNPQPTGAANQFAAVLSIVRPWGVATAQVFWNGATGAFFRAVDDGVVNSHGQEMSHSLNWCN